MLIEIGHFAAIAALIVVLAQAAGLVFTSKLLLARRLVLELSQAQFYLLSFSLVTLTISYVHSDFTVVNVIENSHSLKPLLYKITGVWGNHEGSILFWVWVLSLYAYLFSRKKNSNNSSLVATTAGLQAIICASFLGFMLFTSNPFLRAFPAPADGNDLNPLLQDPGLAFHPPLLYLGYVGFSLVFAIAAAALILRPKDTEWIALMRPWALVSWSFLTLGIGLGSWWAYYELGWGGFWFWDPVENASLMPWLAGTALVHSLIVSEKRDSFKPWTIFLALLTFSLSLIGTFLVRSGILTSIHAFANDPSRGLYLLLIVAVLSGLSFTLFALRAGLLRRPISFAFFSKENGIMINNLFLSVCCATVFIGTLYPLVLDVLFQQKVTVGPPYFALTFVPLFLPLMVAMGLAPLMRWKISSWNSARKEILYLLLATIAILSLYALIVSGNAIGLLCLGFGLWLILAMLWGLFKKTAEQQKNKNLWQKLRAVSVNFYALFFSHLGLGICALGIAGTVYWQEERIVALPIGGATTISSFQVTLESVNEKQQANFISTYGTLRFEDGEKQFYLYPEKRFYPSHNMTTTEAAIRTNFLRDLYAALGDQDKTSEKWTVRIHRKPLAPWIWLGAIVMALGGFIAAYANSNNIQQPV